MPANTAYRPSKLPYPWSDGPGLAPVLDDPDLWSLVTPRESRELIKASRPAGAIGRRRLDIEDDERFGVMVVELLAAPAKRAAASQRLRAQIRRAGLDAFFGLPELLAEQLVAWIAVFGDPCCKPFVDGAVLPAAYESALTPARFRELATTLPDAALPDVALLACAQGILRRRDALEYANVLVDRAPGYKELLFGAFVGDSPRDPERAHALLGADRPLLVCPVAPEGQPLQASVAPPDALEVLAREVASSRSTGGRDAALPPAGEAESSTVFDAAIDLPVDEPVDDATAADVSVDEARPSPPIAVEVTPQMLALRGEIEEIAAELGVSPSVPDISSASSERAYLDELELLAMDLGERRQRRREVESIAATSSEAILAADPLNAAGRMGFEECVAVLEMIGGDPGRDPRAQRWRRIDDDDLMVVAMVAHVLREDPVRAARLLASSTPSLRRRVIGGLDSRHVAELLLSETTHDACLELVVRIIGDRGHSALLHLLQPAVYVDDLALPPRVRAFIEASVVAGERGEPVDAILRALVCGRRKDGDVEPKARLLALIDQPPGMTGYFHRLRVSAQSRFLRPLRGLLAEDKPRAALATFAGYGELELMVAECVGDLPGNGIRALEDQHIEQTRRYLDKFRELLDEWAAGPEDPTARPGARGLVAAWKALAQAGGDFVAELKRRVAEPRAVGEATVDAERWWYREREGVLVVDDVVILPAMIRSWISAAQGDDVPLDAWAWDRARVLLDQEWSARRSVERMLAAGFHRAARLAADVETSLGHLVSRSIEAERARLEARFAAPLSRARGLRARDNEVDDYLASLEDALGALDFAAAELWLEGLDDLLVEVALRSDPERRALVDFLAEAGQRPSTSRPSIDELRADLESLRAREEDRRWHLLVLETVEAGLAGDLRSRLQGLAAALDRPSRWPDAERSRAIGDAIEALIRYCQAQHDLWREYHEIDPGDVLRELVDLLERTLAALPEGDDVERLLALRRAIDQHAPFEHIAELISPSLRRRADEAYFESVRASAREHLRRGEYKRVLADLRGIPGAEGLLLQAELGELLHRGTPLDLDWVELRRVLEQLREHEDLSTPRLEALDAIARVIAETPPKTWPIDHLAASPRAQGGEVQLRAALFVLSLHLRVAKQRPPSEGVTLAMVLPEQVFRVWARWQLDLDYGSVPSGHVTTWRQVRSLWDPDGRGNVMRIPEPGEKFPSFRCFAIFAQVEASLRRVAGLERTVHDLYAALRTLQVRHDGAHALAHTSAERRRTFFALVERWLDRLYGACPVPVEREEIEALLEPLA